MFVIQGEHVPIKIWLASQADIEVGALEQAVELGILMACVGILLYVAYTKK